MITCHKHKIANFKLLLILSTFFEDVKALNFPQANTYPLHYCRVAFRLSELDRHILGYGD